MPAAVQVQYTNHSPGLPHARDTVRKMAALAKDEQSGGHSYYIRHWATRVTHHVPSKQPAAELAALYVWVRENIRYRNDPHGLEWVQSPKRTLIELAGDCDDMAVLLGAGAIALGRPIRFEIAGPAPGRYSHVYPQAQLPDGRWITLDPVLEPPGTGKPRTDLGKFGHRIAGYTKRFNADGVEMLSGPTTKADRTLWQTVPYFPQVPPVSGSANPADAGRSPAPNTAYRSRQVAGPTIRTAPGPSGVMPYSGLGHYTTIARPYGGQVALGDRGEFVVWDDDLGGWGFLKKIGKAFKGVVKVVTKIPGINIAASLIPGGATALAVTKKLAKMLPGGKKKRTVSRLSKRTVDRIRRRAKKGRGRGLRIAKGVAAELERKRRRRKRRVVRGRGRKKKSKVVRRKRRRPTARRRVIRRRRPKAKVVRRRKRIGRKKLRRAARRKAAAAQKRPHPELRSKYPPDARQLWDATLKRFRIFIPVAGGLGACPPGMVPAMPGTPGAVPQSVAWERYRSGVGQLPIPIPVPLPLLLGQLPIPLPVPFPGMTIAGAPLSISLNLLGQWEGGVSPHPNTRHRHSVQCPDGQIVYTSFEGWLTSGHAVLGAAEPARLRAAAQAAVDAVAAHIRSRGSKRPPGRSVPAVLALQLLDPDAAHGGRPGGLDPDGLWGKNSRTAAAYYLNKPATSLPPILPVFARLPLTWSPAPAPVAVTPTPTPTRIPTPTPAPVVVPTAPTRIRTTAPAVVVSKPPAPTRVITRAPVKITTKTAPIVIQPTAPRKLETFERYKAPVVVPPPVPTGTRYPPGVVTMPTAKPVPTPRVYDVARLPVTTGPVAPIPVAPPVNTTAAPSGQYPPGAIYRDASNTPRVSGYAEVAQETNNPGMDPVGMNPPPGQAIAPVVAYGPGSVVQVDRGASNNTWMLFALAWFATTRWKKKAA